MTGRITALKASADAANVVEDQVKILGPTAELILGLNPADTDSLVISDLMAAHGLDPAEWIVSEPPMINRWDALAGNGIVTTLAQIKIRVTRVEALVHVMPATPPDPASVFRPRRRRAHSVPKTAVLMSDQHCPHRDDALHYAACELIHELQPDEIHNLGDGMDLSKPSRHRTAPEFQSTPNQCIVSYHATLRDQREAAPNARITAQPGNHDVRVDLAVQERLPELVDLRNAKGEPAFGLPQLLLLDDLAVEWIDPGGDYHGASIQIVPGDYGLTGKHGTKAGKHGGAVKAIERRAASFVQGHDHKQGVFTIVRYDNDGIPRVLRTISLGAMCRRDLGYMDDPDTAQGFATVTWWPDGIWHVDLATWDHANQVLTWRDKRY